MDLRIIKTLTIISNSFYELCAEKTINKIRVKDIVTRAKINKTTFYRYYKNMEQLTDELETAEIKKIMDSTINYALFFESPALFFNTLIKRFVSSERLRIFYDKNRTSTIAEKLCASIFESICTYEPKIKNKESAQYILNFFLYGIIHNHFIIFQKHPEKSI